MPLKAPKIGEREALILRHYAVLRLGEGWPGNRFDRLCRTLQCTREELAALVGISRAELRRSLKQDVFSVSASIHLMLIDQAQVKEQTGLIGLPVMPIALLFNESDDHKHHD